MIFPRSIITIFMSIACVFVAPCLPQALAEPERADWLYLKAAPPHNNADNEEATVEFKPLVTKYPQSNDPDNVQVQRGKSDRNRGDYEAAIEAYPLVSRDDSAIDEAALAIGEAYLMPRCHAEVFSSYPRFADKSSYLNHLFARSAQERMDALIQPGALYADLKPHPQAQRDHADYQMSTVYFNPNDDDTPIRKFNKIYVDYPESELAGEGGTVDGGVGMFQISLKKTMEEGKKGINLTLILEGFHTGIGAVSDPLPINQKRHEFKLHHGASLHTQISMR
ncbi:hypothetical protein HYR99_35880 [Candidatus Poribacteria bacterium]|nr:hypothetical protein [Candidatus Poribacteria bacterium]